MYKLSINLLVIFLFSAFYVKAEVNINSDFRYIELGKQLQYFSTKKDQLTIDSLIKHKKNNAFFESNKNNLLLLNESEYLEDLWVHFKVNNHSKYPKDLILQLNNPLIDKVEYYEVTNNVVTHKNIAGDVIPINYRFVNFRNPLYPISIQPQSNIDIYFKFSTAGRKIHVPLEIFSYEYFIEYIAKHDVNLGLFYGMLICLSCVSFVLFLLIKEKVYFYLSCYFTIQTLMQISISGIAYISIWPSFPEFANKSVPILMSLNIFIALLFLVEFFGIHNINKYILIAIRFFQVLSLATLLGSCFNGDIFYVSIWVLYRIIPLFYIGLFVISSHIFVKKIIPARFFIVAFTLSLFTIIVIYYYAYTGAHNNIFTNELVIIGEVLKSILLMVALMDRLRVFKSDKELAQQQVIAQLEELNRYKEDLNKQLSDKINKTTSELFAKQNEVKRAMILGEEQERKRIALELHDGLGSLLSTLKLNAQTINLSPELSNEKESEAYKSVLLLIDVACEELRNISHNMMPVGLEQFGLVQQLVGVIRKINTTERLNISLHTNGFEERLDKDLELSLYRICLELLNNIIKHAGASKALLQLTKTDSQIILMLEDDGIGIEYQYKEEGMGLVSIWSRVEAYNGTITIDSNKNGGTTTIIELPI